MYGFFMNIQRLWRQCQLWLIAVLFVAVNAVFILGVTFGIPLSDEWRWVKELLFPLQRGEIGLGQYLLGEYAFLSHSHYLALLFLWFDYSYLSLDFRYFSYLGLLFYLSTYVALLVYCKRYLFQDINFSLAPILILSVGYFCITSDFPWLLVVFEYVYFFIAIITLLMLDSFLQGRVGLKLLLATMLGCLVLADTIGMAAVFMCLFALLINAIFVPAKRKPFFLIMAVITAFFVLQYFLLGKGIGISAHSRVDTLIAMLRNPADTLISFMSIFSQPLVDINILKYVVGERNAPILQFGLGICGFIFTAWMLYYYFNERGWQKSQLPLLFIGYSMMTWALIFISRYQDYGVSVMDEPRYVRLFTLIYVGVGIAAFCITHTVQIRRVFTSAAVILLCTYSGSAVFKYWQDQYIESYFSNAKAELLKEPIDSQALAVYIGRCANDYCTSVVEQMRAEKLSIFKESDIAR
jgi:hypothetical protein